MIKRYVIAVLSVLMLMNNAYAFRLFGTLSKNDVNTSDNEIDTFNLNTVQYIRNHFTEEFMIDTSDNYYIYITNIVDTNTNITEYDIMESKVYIKQTYESEPRLMGKIYYIIDNDEIISYQFNGIYGGVESISSGIRSSFRNNTLGDMETYSVRLGMKMENQYYGENIQPWCAIATVGSLGAYYRDGENKAVTTAKVLLPVIYDDTDAQINGQNDSSTYSTLVDPDIAYRYTDGLTDEQIKDTLEIVGCGKSLMTSGISMSAVINHIIIGMPHIITIENSRGEGHTIAAFGATSDTTLWAGYNPAYYREQNAIMIIQSVSNSFTDQIIYSNSDNTNEDDLWEIKRVIRSEDKVKDTIINTLCLDYKQETLEEKLLKLYAELEKEKENYETITDISITEHNELNSINADEESASITEEGHIQKTVIDTNRIFGSMSTALGLSETDLEFILNNGNKSRTILETIVTDHPEIFTLAIIINYSEQETIIENNVEITKRPHLQISELNQILDINSAEEVFDGRENKFICRVLQIRKHQSLSSNSTNAGMIYDHMVKENNFVILYLENEERTEAWEYIAVAIDASSRTNYTLTLQNVLPVNGEIEVIEVEVTQSNIDNLTMINSNTGEIFDLEGYVATKTDIGPEIYEEKYITMC